MKLKMALAFCDTPFALNPVEAIGGTAEVAEHQIRNEYLRTQTLTRTSFALACRYAGGGGRQFTDAASALRAIAQLPEARADGQCLPRSLLAAKMSKAFASKGVLLIGALIPTGQMHAWIIEGDCQPDPEDRIWINYRPLLALV